MESRDDARRAHGGADGDAKFITLALEDNENPYPSGWRDALPKHVVCNRYVQLDDTGTSLASWEKVEGGHSIAHPGASVGRPVPLEPEKPAAPATFLHQLAEKRGLKLVE